MSFSTEVKAELCRVSMQRACCTRAEAYGVDVYKRQSFPPRLQDVRSPATAERCGRGS